MDEELITEIIAAEGATPEQAAYIARAQSGLLADYATDWDIDVWHGWTKRERDARHFERGWDAAARLAGNPAA